MALPPDLLILLAVLAASVVVGVPAILTNVWMPRDLRIDIVPEGDLDVRQAEHFLRLDAALRPLGYDPFANVRAGLQGSNINRLYTSPSDPALLMASALRSEPQGGATMAETYMEFVTKYRDGTTLMTRNANLSEVFDRMPHHVVQHAPALRDPARLKRHHERRAESLLAREPLFVHRDAILPQWQDYHSRFCAFQVERGLLRYDESSGRYRPTVKTALRGVFNFFNPFADNFTLSRFLLGLALGAGIPASTLLALSHLVVPAAARIAALAAAFGLGGAAVGYVFTSKHFIWGLALGYVPLRLLGEGAGLDLVLVLGMGLAAQQVAAWRMTRLAPV